MASTAKVYALFDRAREHSLEDQIALLADITQSFAESLEIDATLNNAIARFMEYLDAEAASIFLLEGSDSELVCRACAGPVDILGLRLPADVGIIGRTVAARTCQIVRDVSTDPAFAGAVDAGTGFVTRSILCTPLLLRDRCIGALELINKRSGDGLFDDQDRHLLGALASAATLAIHNARMADRLVEQERMRRELQLAREIQEDLLPPMPAADFPVAGINIPALEVSGDFYDFLRRDDGRVYFCIADVSGKGVNAALLMAKASSLLRHMARQAPDPGTLLARANDEICGSVSRGMFVTVVAGFYDPATTQVQLANAGHQPPLLARRVGGYEELPATAPPLGIVAGCEFPVQTFHLGTDCLYVFTDGVTEVEDTAERPLEVAGLMDLIGIHAHHGHQQRLRHIVTALEDPAYTRHDDITFILVEGNRP